MKKKKIRKDPIWDRVKWEDVEVEDENRKQELRKDFEFVNWEEIEEIYGYYIGVKETKNGKLIGLLMKHLPEDDEIPCYAFSITKNLRKKLESVEKNGRLFYGTKIKLVDIVKLDDNRKMFIFDVKTTPEVKIDEDVIMQKLSFTPKKLTGGEVI